MAKILLVEDEDSLRATIAYNLKKAGHEIRLTGDGETALTLAGAEPLDLVVLDIMLPTIDGFDVCRALRRTSSVPILFLTARDDEIDRVVGLEIGGDDYLTKPFSMRELMARVKALLRRRELLAAELSREPDEPPENRLEVGDLEIDVPGHQVRRGGCPVALTPREFDLLVFLVRNRGHIFSAEQLLERVWGYDYVADPRTVAVHIHGLREKLEDVAARPRRIETVRGVGYRFIG